MAAALAVAAAVGAASLAPPPSKGSAAGRAFYGVPAADLALHFVGYLLLTYLAVRAVDSRSGGNRSIYVEAAVLGVVTFGVALEALQNGVPGRGFSTLDAVSNAAGAVVGYVLVRQRGRDRRP